MKVFVSHSLEDKELARQVAEALVSSGVEVWTDEEILPGENWAAQISKALDTSDAMVALLTPSALTSSWVQREIEFALGNKNFRHRLIPVVVGSLPEGQVPWILRKLQIVHLPSTAQADRVADQITRRLAAAS